jgi:hypothetical protein
MVLARLLAGAGTVLGLVGLLALPQQEAHVRTGDVKLDYRDLHSDADAFSGAIRSWWAYGLVVVAVLVAVGVVALVATGSRAVGAMLAILAVAAGVVHAVVLDRTDLSSVFAPINPDPGYAYDRYGSGAWCLLAGLGVVGVAAGLASTGRRRSAEGRP